MPNPDEARWLLLLIPLFLASIFVWNAVLFKPMLNLLDRRREATVGAVEESGVILDEAEKTRREYEEILQKAKQEVAEERAKIRREGEEEAEKALRASRSQAEKILAEMKERIDKEMADAEAELRVQAKSLSKDITTQLLGRSV